MNGHDLLVLVYWTIWSGFCFGVGCLFTRAFLQECQQKPPAPLSRDEKKALKKLSMIDEKWR